MATTYLSGGRIQGRSDDSELAAMPQTSWKELGRYTLTGEADTINVGNGTQTGSDGLGTGTFAAKDNLMILCYIIGNGTIHPKLRFNTDTGSNYAARAQTNGAGDWSHHTQDYMRFGGGTDNTDQFIVTTIRNTASEEKLANTYMVYDQSNTLYREESSGKWANTSNQITSVQVPNGQSGGFSSGSEVVVLGCDDDEADSGTNFWQEIEKSPAYTSGTDLSSGTVQTNTFTAKKYLMVNVRTKATSTNYANYKWRFNSDTGSNYSTRYSDNGGSDGTSNSASNIMTRVGEVASSHALANAFIINKADKEKWGILHVTQAGAAGAGTAPTRHEVVFKWNNTSDQITSMGGVSSSGSGTNLGELEIRIWGAD